MIYGIISDTHNHKWSAFSSVDSNGINSRLRTILDKTIDAAKAVKEAGGELLIHAGDMFHVRGNVSPSVLNPTLETYEYIIKDLGLEVYAIAGNHDLETKDAQNYMGASEALRSIGLKIANEIVETDNHILIPWWNSVDELGEVIDAMCQSDYSSKDLIIHAPVNGVIYGIPDHGFDAGWLGRLPLRRVFAGHYHNHVDFGNGVYSIGALTHQTWGDVGTKAGYLIVDDESVTHYETDAPRFVDLNPAWTTEEVIANCKGNYVRAKLTVEDEKEATELREYLTGDMSKVGALGLSLQLNKRPKNEHVRGVSIESGTSLAHSVGDYIAAKKYANDKRLFALCEEILGEVA